eukprot:4972674-Prymnesium_polylepis.1
MLSNDATIATTTDDRNTAAAKRRHEQRVLAVVATSRFIDRSRRAFQPRGGCAPGRWSLPRDAWRWAVAHPLASAIGDAFLGSRER